MFGFSSLGDLGVWSAPYSRRMESKRSGRTSALRLCPGKNTGQLGFREFGV